MGPQGLLDVVLPLLRFHRPDVGQAEQLGDLVEALLGQRHDAVLFVDRVIAGVILFAGLLAFDHFAADQARDDRVGLVILVGGFLAGTADDQRRAGLVDQDRIDLVDDGVVVAALGAIVQAEFHVVAQVVEAELVVGAVGDVAGVGGFALLVVQAVDHQADRQTHELVEAAHPLRVAAGQVVVDRHDMDAGAREAVQIHRQSGGEGLAFAGFHFRNLAAMEYDAANQLHVEMAHFQNSSAGFAHRREGFDEQVVERRSSGQLVAEFLGLGGEFRVAQRAHGGLEIVDQRHQRLDALDLALVLSTENFRQYDIDNHKGGVVFRRDSLSF